MLILLKILMPLSTPVQADSRKQTVMTAIMIMLMVTSFSVPNTAFMPERTISVPIASDPARPKTTAMTARISAVLPIPRSTGALKTFLKPTTIGVDTIDGSFRRKVK